MKRLFIFFTLLFSGFSQAEALKIGYINIDHLVTSSPQFIQANQQVINEFQPQQDKLITLANEIDLLVGEFNKNKKDLSQSEVKSEVKKITKLEQHLKQQASILKKQLSVKNKEELSKIQDLINQIIKQVATDEGFDLILYQEVAYASKKINITPVIAQKLRLEFE